MEFRRVNRALVAEPTWHGKAIHLQLKRLRNGWVGRVKVEGIELDEVYETSPNLVESWVWLDFVAWAGTRVLIKLTAHIK